MAKASKKKHSNKFPLTLHKTGQYCKKIQGRLFYFGKDRAEALRRYQEQATELHTGPRHGKRQRGITLRDLANEFLGHQEGRVVSGEIRHRQYYDQRNYLRNFAEFIKPDTKVSDIATMDLQDYRTNLVKAKLSANTINNRIGAVKALFSWAIENEILEKGPGLKAIKRVPPKKVNRQVFTPEEIKRLLKHANPQMTAMILLGLNAGFGCTDCAELQWDHLDLEAGRVAMARGKTGVQRNVELWPETIEALKSLKRMGDRVFQTRLKNSWVRENGSGRHSDAISCQFAKLAKEAGVKLQRYSGFYTLRRTSATWTADATGDAYAVMELLGHATTRMASVYVQPLHEKADAAAAAVRKRLNGGK